jgi:hypothetical protein
MNDGYQGIIILVNIAYSENQSTSLGKRRRESEEDDGRISRTEIAEE